MLKQVTVSGTVGKQVVARNSSEQATLKGVILTPSGANATIKIRDGIGGVSGEVVLFARATSAAGQSLYLKVNHKFLKGLHVTVIGTNAEAYLDIT
jgi:hypothetical protein